MVALGEESKAFSHELSRYEEQRVTARLQAAAFDRVREALATRDVPIEGFMIGEKDDPVLASLSSDLAQARQQLRQVEERFTAEAPATIEQRALVKNQLKMVKDYVVSRAARAQKEVESLDEVIARFEDKLKTVPAAQQELARLSREAEVLGKVYALPAGAPAAGRGDQGLHHLAQPGAGRARDAPPRRGAGAAAAGGAGRVAGPVAGRGGGDRPLGAVDEHPVRAPGPAGAG